MKTILVVDDSKTIRTAVAWSLRGTNVELMFASSSDEVKSQLTQKQPDLMLIDIGLEPEDGLSLCSSLKAQAQYGSVPMIVMPGASSAFESAQANAAGADDYIEKPFETQKLLSLISKHFGWSQPEPEPLTYAGQLAKKQDSSEIALALSPSSSEVTIASAPPSLDILDTPVLQEILDKPPYDEPVEVGPELVASEIEPDTASPIKRAETIPSLGPNNGPLDGDEDLTSTRVSVESEQIPEEIANSLTDYVVTEATTKPAPALKPEDLRLPTEELRAIARDVIESIAWEVVPDLAEMIIREEISRLLGVENKSAPEARSSTSTQSSPS